MAKPELGAAPEQTTEGWAAAKTTEGWAMETESPPPAPQSPEVVLSKLQHLDKHLAAFKKRLDQCREGGFFPALLQYLRV